MLKNEERIAEVKRRNLSDNTWHDKGNPSDHCKACRYAECGDNPSVPQSLLSFFFPNTPFYFSNPFLIFQHL